MTLTHAPDPGTVSPAGPDVQDALEAEAIHIIREVVAEFERPAMLFSGGKDSLVMLRCAEKAFGAGRIPYPLLMIDTGHNFPEVTDFRDFRAQELGAELIVRSVEDSMARGTVRLAHPEEPRNAHQSVTLLEAIEEFRFDALIGGARRDEEKSRAKERVFSFRDAAHRWDPRRQRPELWNLYNARVGSGESVRVFPLSNWTELDVWRYIRREAIDVVPLYFAAERPVVHRDGTWIMVDDDRFVLRDGESVEQRRVRFRTLGCYPLTGAVESEAADLDAVIREMENSALSERAGRLIDHADGDSMEKKKREGYF